MKMMKDYANPLLLLVVIVLMACRGVADAEATAGHLDAWILSLCVTGVLVDAALALAKSMAHRPSLMNVVWSVAFLILGSCAFALRSVPLSEEQTAFLQQYNDRQDPFARDAEGETLFTRAAALGKEDVVKSILDSTTPPEELICEAGLRAAESNKVAILDKLARVGMTADASAKGVPLLHAAAQNGACDAIRWLLERGARVNTRDTEGSTPLIQATLAGSVPAVKLLLDHGADKALRDTSGHSAEDFARTEELRELVAQPAPNPMPDPHS